MSLSGGLRWSLDLCSIRWERHIIEHHLELAPGWHLSVTLPFVDITVDSYGWEAPVLDRLKRKPWFSTWHNGVDVSWAGFAIGIQGDNGNEPELVATGDYERSREWQEKQQ